MLTSCSSRLHLLSRLPLISIIPYICPLIMCFRRQFLQKISPIQLVFLLFTAGRVFPSTLAQCNNQKNTRHKRGDSNVGCSRSASSLGSRDTQPNSGSVDRCYASLKQHIFLGQSEKCDNTAAISTGSFNMIYKRQIKNSRKSCRHVP
jgi:hypothetical protein